MALSPVFRSLALACAAVFASACTSVPGLTDPEVTLSPRYYLYKPKGSARMQSSNGGRISENSKQDLETLGMSRRDDDYGGVVAIGNGFEGIEIEYQKVDLDDTTTGVLSSEYGSLPTGMAVSSEFMMDEMRLSYVAGILDRELDVDDDNWVRFRLGAGGTLVHREGRFKVLEANGGPASQSFKFSDGGVAYLSLRARADWREFSAQIDWDYSPDLAFGGDFEGNVSDLEFLIRYAFEAQDIDLLAGYRWSELQMTGRASELRYDAAFDLNGFVLGLEFRF
ncbi:MAG: hypothetical protein ACO3RU_03660 [Planctomycetota bacterium]